jgi:AcrR family transcriptional regulator
VSQGHHRKDAGDATSARSRTTAEAIIKAACELLVQHGYQATSLHRVARHAGLSLGSVQQCFATREALVAELIERQANATLASTVKVMAEVAALDFEDSVRLLLRTMFAGFAEQGAINRVLLEQLPQLGHLEKLHAVETRAIQVAHLYLQTQRLRLRPLDLGLAARLMVHTVASVAHTWTLRYPQELKNPQLAEEVADSVLRYLLRLSGPGPGAPAR